jgi:uncharacterized membrane protein YjjB (DUF3815 family)
LGIVLGVELILWDGLPIHPTPAANADHLNLVSDVVLAGLVTCGFAVFYNTAWAQVGLAAVGGMAGHGLRFLALEAGCRLKWQRFWMPCGGRRLGLDVLCARVRQDARRGDCIRRRRDYDAGVAHLSPLAGALQLARLTNETDPAAMAGTLGNAVQACLVVSGLALGLVLGARAVLALVGHAPHKQEAQP